MEIWEEQELELIGGTTVLVLLEESWEIDGPPHMEVSTHFRYPVEGCTYVWSYALPLSDFLEGEEMLQAFRQEVARWERLKARGQ